MTPWRSFSWRSINWALLRKIRSFNELTRSSVPVSKALCLTVCGLNAVFPALGLTRRAGGALRVGVGVVLVVLAGVFVVLDLAAARLAGFLGDCAKAEWLRADPPMASTVQSANV